MVNRKKLKTRLDATEELDNIFLEPKPVYVVEENGKKVSDPRNMSLPSNRIKKYLDTGAIRAEQKAENQRLYNNVKETLDNVPFTSRLLENNRDEFLSRGHLLMYEQNQKRQADLDKLNKLNKSISNDWINSGAFKDGYDFGDISRTILASTNDLKQDLTTGFLKIGEGTIDAGAYILGKAGNVLQIDGSEENMQKFIEKDLINEEKISKGLNSIDPIGQLDTIINQGHTEDNSIFDEKADSLVQSGGQLVGTFLLQAGGVPWWLTTGATSYGSATEEAFKQGATYNEAGGYALINAGSEVLFEKLSGGISFKGKTLDDTLLKPFTDKITDKTAKTLIKYGIDVFGEGGEELLTEVTTNIGKKLTYEDEKTWEEILLSEEAMESYLDSFIGGSLLGGVANVKRTANSIKTGRDYDTGYTQNEQKVVDSLVEEQASGIAKTKAIENEIKKAITARETEQGGILSTKEKSAITEAIKAKIDSGEIDVSNNKLSNKEISKIRQEVEENLNKGLLDTTKIDNILGNSITEQDGLLAKSYLETAKKSETFTYDSKKIKNEQEKAVYESAAKYLNNTTRSHEFVEKVAKISKDKGTNYGFINNEELKSLGHDIEGKQVNGLVRTNKDGKQTVLINIDSPKALNTIVGHETTHLLEGTQEYKDLQEAIFNYAKEKGDFYTRQEALNSLYEGIENANIDAELTADLVGDYLFTDNSFIENLSIQKPTVFQKIKSFIDDLVIRFKGTKEEKQLREVQKKFREAYRKNATDINFATNETFKTKQLNETQQQEVINKTKANIKSENVEMVSTDALLRYREHDRLGKDKKHTDSELIELQQSIIENGIQNPINILYNPKTGQAFVNEGNTRIALANSIKLSQVPATVTVTTDSSQFEGKNVMYLKKGLGNGTKSLKPSELAKDFTTKDVQFSLSNSKVSKQYLEKQFKELTGDDILKADAVLGGIALRNSMRETGNRTDAIESSPYSDEAMEIYKTYKNSRKSSNALYHTTPRENLQSILTNGLTTNNPARQVGVSGEGKLYVAANEELASSFGEDTDILLRINPNYNLENLDYDLLGGEGTYSTTDNIPASALQVKENGKWVKLENSQLAKGNIKYSLTDNQGRTLTKEQQEYFKDSKVRDEEGRLLEVYHGTPYGGFTVFDKNMFGNTDGGGYLGDGFYFANTEDLARAYTDEDYEYSNPEIKSVYLNMTNPYIISDKDVEYGENMLEELGTSTEQLKNQGYDGIIYELNVDESIQEIVFKKTGKRNTKEIEYVVFEPNQIKNIDNTNPTSDADIRYSLTPDYGMSHRPSTDYGDASNFEENMPDVFEHPEWYMFGGDGWYKKAYNESWNALKKVRNNPDGEITIYRATIGDSFNEGDWVSPSKAYAEWHNYSNLEGKGNVIELKVKAKDIRFAGDDLNEFGYFPNGVDEYSLSNFNEQRAAAKGNYNVYGEDVKLQQAITPLQEEIQQSAETIKDLKVNTEAFKQDIAPVKTEVEYTQPTKAELDNLMALQKTGGTEYANTFFGLRDKYGQPKLYKGINEYKKAPDTYEAPIKGDEFAAITEADLPMFEKQNQEAFNNIDESSMPNVREDTTPDIEEMLDEMYKVDDPFDNRSIEEVGKRNVNAYQYDHPEVKPFFQQEAKAMLGDLYNSVKGERYAIDVSDQGYDLDLVNGHLKFTGVSRQTTDEIAYLLDNYNYSYADIEKGLKAIIEDNGKENIAVAKRIEFMLNDRLMKGYRDIYGYNIPPNQEYINMMKEKQITDYYNSLPIDDSMIPYENAENVSNSKDIAPIKKLEKSTPRTTETSIPEPINKAYQLTIDGKAEKIIDNPTYNQIAEVLTTEPKTESDRNNRKWAIFKANVFDKGMVFEDLSLKTGNRELQGKWDYTLTSDARGQYVIGNGHNGLSKSLNDIRQEVDNTGLTKEFYNYMYHKHNVDRMSLDKRFGVENKPVFGDSVTAEQSQAIVNQYENAHPEFMDFAQDVYDYVNADKQLLIDSGVISQETADLWTKMYPHYVPTRRTTDTGLDINVPLDTGKTGINSPIKKATGGSADILPLFDTMAMRTLQTHRATSKNNFGIELKNTLGTTLENSQASVDEIIDSLDAQEGLLQEGTKGKNPTFTVFENGEKITFEITKDMYDALKPLSESSILSKTIKPLNVASNIRRGLLTEYNPTFMLTNAIKDTQDILINSQHPLKTYAKIAEAHKQLLTKGYWYEEYIRNGGEQNSYFDNETKTFKAEKDGIAKKVALAPLKGISKLNNYIEMIPRLAEYIASRESGRSIEVSMLDAARVTTNFKAGGAVTKFANRNGATFLNASVQGAMQQVRNIREANANGIKGWVKLAAKFTVAGLPAILLNNFIWDDDEEYEELSDYVKQNYYIVGKMGNGTFIRIPKGRTTAVIQEGLNQMENLITGDDEADLKTFIDLTINNLAPNNPIENNIFSPIVQVMNNKTWYGGDLVPTRLQDMPVSEQYDESTDMFSRWIGETFNVSPYKVNYLIDQYSGGVGDVVLPMMTPEAESGGDSLTDYLLAPFKSKFTTNSTLNNQNISDFYDTSEELTTNAKKTDATDNDLLSNKYINSVKAEMNELYKEKREIQNSNLSNSEKYEQTLELQSQINDLAENALSEYTNVSSASNYATVGDREYYKKVNSEGETEWTKINDDLAEDLEELGLTDSEKNTYFKTKDEISSIDDSETKKVEIIKAIKDTGFNDEQKAYMYKKYYNTDTVDTIVSSGIDIDAYFDYASKEFVADKDENGKTISGSRKDKVINYVNGLNLSIPEKAILIKATNTFKFNDYNNQIVNYVKNLNISEKEKVSILEELDMKVNSNGDVTWE